MYRVAIALAVASTACGRIGFASGERPEPDPDAAIESCLLPGATLLGDWSMNGSDVTGGVVRDRSGNGRDGTLAGALPVIAAGQVGDALDYSGAAIGFVDLPDLPVDSTIGAATTISLWYFRSGPSVDESLVFLPPGPGAAPPRYDLWLTDVFGSGSMKLCINSGVGDCWGVDESAIPGGLLDRWVHVTAVFVNGRIDGGTLFVDGAAVTVSCLGSPCSATRVVEAPFTIGGSDPTYAWHGSIDEVRIFDGALTQAEAFVLFGCD